MSTAPSSGSMVPFRWVTVMAFLLLLAAFGALSPRFLSLENVNAILVQSSWLVVVAVGMNFALLAAGVDLSVGSAMYVAAVIIGMALTQSPVWMCLLMSLVIGASFGLVNAVFIVRFGVPAFIATLATTFVGRGLGLYLSSTQIAYAGGPVANLGRTVLFGLPCPLWIVGAATVMAWIVLNRTPMGPYIRSIGANLESARRVGVPIAAVSYGVYLLCGAFAGLGGFVSLSLTSAATGAFGQGCEFLAIAAAVLGGTSLFGGRGNLWAPVVGALLITTVQNGLVMIDANPYAYPVITGGVIFIAALFDGIRSRLQKRMERRWVCKDGAQVVPLSLPSPRVRS
jgi:ribose transport system permease protein